MVPLPERALVQRVVAMSSVGKVPGALSYSDVIRKHFLDPRNVGELADADGVGEAGNAACGDELRVFIRVNTAGALDGISFQAKACSAVIAVASMTTEALEGATTAQARALDVDALVEQAGGVPRHKAHAPRVVRRALDAALSAAGV